MPGRMEFEFRFSRPATPQPRRVGGPFRILILGDFSGRSNRGIVEAPDDLAGRSPLAFDVDNLEQVLARLDPRLGLRPGGAGSPAVELGFAEIEDFHPDALYDRLELFQELRRLRKRLLDPATFAQAAAELKHDASAGTEQPEEDSSTLERLLGRPGSSPAATPDPGRPRARGVEQLIRGIVAPYVVPAADPQQEQFVSAVDLALGDRMRELLHEPAFREMEAGWLALHDLVRGLETDEGLTLHLLDISRAELEQDVVAAGGDLDRTGLYRSIVEREAGTPGGSGWSAVVGALTLGASPADLELLAALGAIAAQAGGPFLAAADPKLLGCESLAASPDPAGWREPDAELGAAWAALRGSAVARWIGLAVPRLLMRLPYGERGEEIDRFPFDELPAGGEHEAYLWGNPAFGCARLLGQSFTERGWSMEPGDRLDVEDLPAHVYDEDGEKKLKPCAEVLLSERAGTEILRRGLMPWLSYRDRNAARLLRFQSIADPATGLSGPW